MCRAGPGPGALSPGAPPGEVSAREMTGRQVGGARPALAAVTSDTAGTASAASDTPPPHQPLLLLLLFPLARPSSFPPGRSYRRLRPSHTFSDASSCQLLSWQGGLGLIIYFLLTSGLAFSHGV